MTDPKRSAVLITGAAGGLGQALVCMALTLPGVDRVVATDIREGVTSLFQDEERVLALPMDVGSETSIREVKERLGREGLAVRYLINNAGIFFFHPVSEMTEALLDRILRVNVYGPVLTVSVFLEDLMATHGRVVQISSVGVHFPTLFQAYPASKIALEALSTSMRQELALAGVELSLVRSGAIDTALVREMKKLPVPAEKSRYAEYYKKFLARVQKDVGRVVSPAAVATVVRRALTGKRPRRVYVINRNRTIRLLSILPQNLLDNMILRMLPARTDESLHPGGEARII